MRKLAPWIADGTALLLLAPVLLLLSPLLAPLVGSYHFGRWVRARRFRRRHAGRLLLICGAGHNWRDFLINNVAPALPPTVSLYWATGKLRADDRLDLKVALSAAGVTLQKPYLIQVTPAEIQTVPLHQPLLPLKQRGARRSAEVQDVILTEQPARTA